MALHHIFPEAPIYTSYTTDEWRKRLGNKVVTGFLQHFPKLRKFIPFLRIWWFSHLDLSGYDLVISSSGAEAKGIRVPDGTIHINYCHAPTHYYWSRYDEYLAHPGFGFLDPLARLGLKLLVGPLRKWDYRAAQRPTFMIANSSHIREEIKKYYDRDAVVINPPVDIERFERNPSPKKRHGFLVGGRLTPYKRNDLAVAACTAHNLPLTVYGDGPDRERLEKMAGPTVTFVGRISDEAAAEAYANAEAFILPMLDDFGVVGIEALAAGTPLIAYKAGGALDYVVEGQTGIFFKEQTAEALGEALLSFNKNRFNSSDIKQKAQAFSPENFEKSVKKFLQSCLDA